MADELGLESLFAAIGLGPILAGDPTLHQYQIHRAAKFPIEIRRRILRFMASDAFKPAKDVPPFDYPATLKAVSSQALQPKAAQALVAAIPDHDLARDMSGFANRIITWANPLLPRETQDALIGAVPDDPSASSIADFRRAWQVALDPMSVLDDLEDGSLSDDQVAALSLLYPAIYGELKQAIVDQDAAMRARRKAWQPAPQKAALLKMIRGESTFDPALAADVQTAYAQEDAQAPQPAGPPKRRSSGGAAAKPSDALTPGQKATTGASGAQS